MRSVLAIRWVLFPINLQPQTAKPLKKAKRESCAICFRTKNARVER